jgi:hypothetical protein
VGPEALSERKQGTAGGWIILSDSNKKVAGFFAGAENTATFCLSG